MKKWKCLICKYIHEGDGPPEKCPICKAPPEKFVAVEPESSFPAADAFPAAAGPKEGPAGGAQAKESPPPQPRRSKAFDRIADLISRHHAHPITVHFPNGVLPVALMMFMLAWLLDVTTLGTAGFYNIVFVMLALPLVIFSGFTDWERKYRKALTSVFMVKIVAAAVTFTACLISLIWYLIHPGVLASPEGWLFILINVVMVAGAGIAGHIGGKLVFKD